jgi:glycosyltransferase involved in cell wall biosynthesis
MLRIAILGIRGIPASYSGFETSAEETAVRFVKSDYKVSVYCRKNHYKNRSDTYLGVDLIYLPSVKSKHLDTITHTILSVFHSMFKKYDVIILYGVGSAYILPILKLFTRKLISVVDGADWERQKWGAFAKFVLRLGRWFSIKLSDHYVVDNEFLAKQYQKKFKKAPVYIPYGANIPDSYEISILEKFNLKENSYLIFVGRFVLEKGIDFLIENFIKLDTKIKLVVVGGNALDLEYVGRLKDVSDDRIIFPGFVYGSVYESLLKFAKFYVSCSYLEGTSPSLLSAMAINGFAYVSDLPENCEVLKCSCQTFKTGDSQSFLNGLKPLLNSSVKLVEERKKTKAVVEKYYTWEKITEQYIQLF